jgi:hypothetical protein
VTTTTWEATLDALEADLAGFAEVVLNRETLPRVPAFQPSAELGPLPAHLAARATALGAAYEAVLERAEAAREQVRTELAGLPRPRVEEAPRRRAAFIDIQS